MLLPSVGYYPRAGSIAQSAPPLESRSSAASPGPTCTGRGPPHHLLMEAGRAESNDRYPHTMQTNYHPPHHIRDIIISDHIMIITRRSIKTHPHEIMKRLIYLTGWGLLGVAEIRMVAALTHGWAML